MEKYARNLFLFVCYNSENEYILHKTELFLFLQLC